eukprot:NODE_23_length_42016_cov_0.755803.p10 type:complete len:433 gc:universal NODE_23_length_42016_cov_0.755803:2011-713(-)
MSQVFGIQTISECKFVLSSSLFILLSSCISVNTFLFFFDIKIASPSSLFLFRVGFLLIQINFLLVCRVNLRMLKRVLQKPLCTPGNAPLLKIVNFIDRYMASNNFDRVTAPPPKVTVQQNFDSLLFPKDHVGRSKGDTYYINDNYVLRTHATCHQEDVLKKYKQAYWICDTYRKDEIDKTHYPIFHQMDAIKIFESSNETEVVADLKQFLEQLMLYLFKNTIPTVKFRWVDAYFPFTAPSFELEAFINGKWLELLGSGVIRKEIIQKSPHNGKIGWACGIGIERLCMLLYNIPDIRLFWTNEPRFNNQFIMNPDVVVDAVPKQKAFKPFSNFQPCYKEISFYINEADSEFDPIINGKFHINSVFDAIRPFDNLIEEVKVSDKFFHPKAKKWSITIKLTFRAWDRTLTNEEINKVQSEIRDILATECNIQLRG